MQGFTTKYYLRKAERGDFVVNRQAVTLHTRKTCQVPLRHNSYQAARKRRANTGKRRSLAKGSIAYIKGLQRKEKYAVESFFLLAAQWDQSVLRSSGRGLV